MTGRDLRQLLVSRGWSWIKSGCLCHFRATFDQKNFFRLRPKCKEEIEAIYGRRRTRRRGTMTTSCLAHTLDAISQ